MYVIFLNVRNDHYPDICNEKPTDIWGTSRRKWRPVTERPYCV